MIEIGQALEIIDREVSALKTEIIPIETSVGRIIAKEILAVYNLPSFDNSAMDGYAVKATMEGLTLPVRGTIFAGDRDDITLDETAIVKIMTGAPVPQGCNAIVPIEEVTIEANADVVLPANIKEHQHVRFSGEDISVGDTLIKAGEKLVGYHTALLASQGISHISVYRKPRVAVFATGEELKMHFETVQSHQIYNSNTPTFLARAKEFGAEVSFIGSAKDNLEDIQSHIEACLDADLIVTSGGVSVGDADFTREAFDAFDMQRLFEKINIKPGKPTTLGKIGKTWVLNLPGNPLAALLNFEIFGSKLLLKLSGNRREHLGLIYTKMAEAIKIKPGRVTVLPGYWDGEGFTPTPKRSPGMISPLIESNAMVILDQTVSTIEMGQEIRILSLHSQCSSDKKLSIITSM